MRLGSSLPIFCLLAVVGGASPASAITSAESAGQAVSAPCTPSTTTLCLKDGRFAVEVDWSDGVASGSGQAVSLFADTGYRFFHITAAGLIPAARIRGDETYRWMNYLFVTPRRLAVVEPLVRRG